jgi:hypothetical protein
VQPIRPSGLRIYVTPYLSESVVYDRSPQAQAQTHVDLLHFSSEEPQVNDDEVGKVEGDVETEFVFETTNESRGSPSPSSLTCLPPSSFSVPLPPHPRPGNGNAGKAHSRTTKTKTTTTTTSSSPPISVDTDSKPRGSHTNGKPSPEPYPTHRSLLHSRPHSEEASRDDTHNGSRPVPIRVRRNGHGPTHRRPGKRERMFKCLVCLLVSRVRMS